jgi:hypothetical protein
VRQIPAEQNSDVQPHFPLLEQQLPKALLAQVAFFGELGPHSPSRLTGAVATGTLLLVEVVLVEVVVREVIVTGSFPL